MIPTLLRILAGLLVACVIIGALLILYMCTVYTLTWGAQYV